MRILYIEDDPNDAQLVALYMNTTPHDLLVVQDGQQARAAFANRPDLILVDMLLGQRREGYKLVEEFRAQGYTEPVIAITGLTTPTDLLECQKVGVDFVLRKPFVVQQLAEALAMYVA